MYVYNSKLEYFVEVFHSIVCLKVRKAIKAFDTSPPFHHLHVSVIIFTLLLTNASSNFESTLMKRKIFVLTEVVKGANGRNFNTF